MREMTTVWSESKELSFVTASKLRNVPKTTIQIGFRVRMKLDAYITKAKAVPLCSTGRLGGEEV
jgi:hypothetical protein